MAGHTPGPWRIYTNPQRGRSIHIVDSTPDVDGKFVGNCICLVALSNPDEQDNARLISAAPELLEALQLLRDMQNGPPVVSQAAKWQKAMDMADSAIRKATHD